MCKECGCGLPGETPAKVSLHHHEHSHEHAHEHTHEHEHGNEHQHAHSHEHAHEHEHGPGHHHGEDHEHAHSHPHQHTHSHSHAHEDLDDHVHQRTLEIREAILAKNDRLAERNRGFFEAHGLLVLNVLSSPGSGKTTLLRETLKELKGKAAVIVGDLATDNDAQQLRESGAPVVQITTGTVCHLEAEMVARAVKQLHFNDTEVLIIENVGNLVCPASYDLGEGLRVVLLSVTEGEDKPLKYPPMFQSADAVVISKMDLAKPCGWNRDAALNNLRRVAPKARILELSAKTGEGMESWRAFLSQKRQQQQA